MAPQATIFGFPLKYVALCALTLQTTGAVILTRYSKMMYESQYRSTTLVMMSEVMKLVMSLALVFIFDTVTEQTDRDKDRTGTPEIVSGDNTPGTPATKTPSAGVEYEDNSSPISFNRRVALWKAIIHRENFVAPMETLKLCVPAALYTLQNNLIYVALSNLEATTFQVGYQSKVITTAALSVAMLNRTLSWRKWAALCLLTTGIIMTQLDSSSGAAGKANQAQDPVLGISAVLVSAFSSAFAGVYFEKILKGSAPSVWVRNAQLAFFGSCFAFMGVMSAEGTLTGFFTGYNAMTWAVIAIQGLGGLIIAVVVKYADNILKGFATAMSIVLCGLLSAGLFGFFPTMSFFFGSSLVIAATFGYSLPE